ncbi:putative tubby-like protein, partial [Tanacetum coccineum]
KLLRFGLWDCYNDKDTRKPWFKVGKTFDLFKHDSVYDVVVGTNETRSTSSSNHKMEGSVHNLEFKIIDSKGKVAAEFDENLPKRTNHPMKLQKANQNCTIEQFLTKPLDPGRIQENDEMYFLLTDARLDTSMTQNKYEHFTRDIVRPSGSKNTR